MCLNIDAIDIDSDGEYRYAMDRGNWMTMCIRSLSIVVDCWGSVGREQG